MFSGYQEVCFHVIQKNDVSSVERASRKQFFVDKPLSHGFSLWFIKFPERIKLKIGKMDYAFA